MKGIYQVFTGRYQLFIGHHYRSFMCHYGRPQYSGLVGTVHDHRVGWFICYLLNMGVIEECDAVATLKRRPAWRS